MKPIHTGVLGAAMLVLTSLTAHADCAADLAAMTGHAAHGEGISKDGSLAPLESANSAAAPATGADTAAAAPEATGGNGIAKDGSHTPLEGAGGQQPGVAMSGADAQAQQEGKPTAAEQAEGGAGGSARTHLEDARAALDAGDEATCRKHLEEARSAS